MPSTNQPPKNLAIVTGTTSGIGQATARALLDRGWSVLGVARRVSTINHEAYEHARVDLHDVDALDATLSARLTKLVSDPALDRVGLVNNAADPGLLGPVLQLDPGRLVEVFASNVAAPIWLMGIVVRLAPPEVALRIVNVSSGAAVSGFPGLAAYGCTKAALRMASMVLAAELDNSTDAAIRNRKIAILSYQPGIVDTPMHVLARGQPTEVLPSRDMFVRFQAEGRLVRPEAPAGEIVDFLEGSTLERFAEQRLGA
jgi:benzil reductase ((S)-benzoin forming)